MMKTSLLLMVVLTVLASIGLSWREKRGVAAPRPGWVATQKRAINRWVTAAAIAAVVTLAVLGGLQWLRVWQG
ncbi:MAG: hypothetical protein H7345_10750 [Rubritepida sp.]|nr:hypothetical protein [Rubritepida sp.]